ncbi:tyrosine-type recombinase/integrase [Citrobacter portucalensis]|uniref:tyrosine-type recombinase/integrase n=1 Tax=Citrobacter portucalensis TaxID=1639133 RepID=UPI003C2BDAE1
MLNSRTYLYQRNGVFYIRLRMKTTGRLTASLPSHKRYKLASVSLRTKDRRTAMAHSRHIKSALKAIHADNPNASYEELREHLKTIVEWELSVSRDGLNDPESYQLYVDQYDDIKSNLREAVATERLTVDQHRYINDVIGVLKACQDRLKGDSSGLLSYLEPETGSLRPSVSLSVLAEPEVPEPLVTLERVTKALTLASLIEQYEQENAQNWKPATLSENRASHSTLIEIFDYLNIQDVSKATRSDMLRVREVLQQIPKNRKQRFKDMPLSDLLNRESKTDCLGVAGSLLDVVTINNKYLIKMAAVFKWAVRNDLIAKNLTEGLELKVPQRKASDARDAFSPEQVGQLLVAAKAYSQKTSGKPYHYYVTALAAITGARLNEVAQLQVKDVRTTEAGTVYIHINEDDSSLPGKSIKNAHSDRCVPLVDGAYGFVLADFMSLVEDRRKTAGDNAMVFDGLKLMKNGYGEQVSKWFNRTLLPKVLADRSGLAFHSFRHTVATQLKQHGVELAYAQAIMGHSSGSITYDRYAKEVEVDRLVNVMAGVYKETGVNG